MGEMANPRRLDSCAPDGYIGGKGGSPLEEMDTLFFFEGKREELALYQRFREGLRKRGMDCTAAVHKTQISLRHGLVFACVSMAKVLPKARRPEHFIVISLGADRPFPGERIVSVEVRPGRWTNHVVLGADGDMDDAFWALTEEAYRFAER